MMFLKRRVTFCLVIAASFVIAPHIHTLIHTLNPSHTITYFVTRKLNLRNSLFETEALHEPKMYCIWSLQRRTILPFNPWKTSTPAYLFCAFLAPDIYCNGEITPVTLASRPLFRPVLDMLGGGYSLLGLGTVYVACNV